MTTDAPKGWISSEITYGLYLSDHSILNGIETELVVLSGIMIQNLKSETAWHLRGSRRVGMSMEDVEMVQQCVCIPFLLFFYHFLPSTSLCTSHFHLPIWPFQSVMFGSRTLPPFSLVESPSYELGFSYMMSYSLSLPPRYLISPPNSKRKK
jgi:hypothetical protein